MFCFFFVRSLRRGSSNDYFMLPKCERARAIANTNITLQRLTPHEVDLTPIGVLSAIRPDVISEAAWFNETFRPQQNLMPAIEAFLQSIKRVGAARDFASFDQDKAKQRRQKKFERDKQVAAERRAKAVAPTAALRAALNPKKLPPSRGPTQAEHEVFNTQLDKRRDEAQLKKKARRNKLAKQAGPEETIARKKRARRFDLKKKIAES